MVNKQVENTNVHYRDSSFKLFIQEETMNLETNYHSMEHIHEELELMYVTEGYLYYDINGEEIEVKQGDCIFVNSYVQHRSYLKESSECKFIVLLIHPSIYAGFISLVQPILENKQVTYYLFHENRELNDLFCKMLSVAEQKTKAYKLALVGYAFNVMKNICEEISVDKVNKKNLEDIKDLNEMTFYVYQHYAEKITLTDIASQCNISVSTCSRLFNKYMHHSPIDFLNLHRLEVASNLLRDTKESISDISLSCGFEQQSYFNRIFKKEYGCTPLEYRRHPVDQYVH